MEDIEFLASEAFKSSGYLVLNKILIKNIGLMPAVILSNYIDKHNYFRRTAEYPGWFYVTHKQIEEEYNIKEHTIVKNKQTLTELGFIELKKMGLPAKEFIKINFEKIIKYFINNTIELDKNNLEQDPVFSGGQVPMFSGGQVPMFSGGLTNKNKYNKNKYNTIRGRSVGITPKLFEYFWTMYPKKYDKGKVLTIWNKLCNKKDRPEWRVIRKAVQDQKKSERWQNPKYIPAPTTWLNQSRWLDDPKEMVSFDTQPETPVNGFKKNTITYKTPIKV